MILHVWSETRPEDQIETKARIETLRTFYPTKSVLAVRPDDYWRTLCDVWNLDDDIINIEQDNVPTLAQVNEIATCPYPLCTFPYWRKETIMLWDYPMAPDTKLLVMLEEPIPDFVKGSGFGCVKIAPSVRKLIDITTYPVKETEWWSIDTWFSTQLLSTGIEWHVHMPFVKHNRSWDWQG